MDKAVLVIDMPMNCYECDLNNYHFCDVTGDSIEEYMNTEYRPNWCPLKPVPKPAKVMYGDDSQDWDEGYNSCLEEILDI